MRYVLSSSGAAKFSIPSLSHHVYSSFRQKSEAPILILMRLDPAPLSLENSSVRNAVRSSLLIFRRLYAVAVVMASPNPSISEASGSSVKRIWFGLMLPAFAKSNPLSDQSNVLLAEVMCSLMSLAVTCGSSGSDGVPGPEELLSFELQATARSAANKILI